MLSDTAINLFSALVIAALAIALVAWIVSVYRQTHYTIAQFPWFYPFNQVMARILWRGTVSGHFDIPPDQGAVIVCNHIGSVDPAFIALATKRVVHWMVAKEYCDHPLMAWFFSIMRAIPVNRRGIDTAATKLAIRYASQGGLVGMFPEGRINETGGLLLPGRPGAALVALRARVPVVPCFLKDAPYDGTSFGAFFIPAKAHLTIGQPLDISDVYGRDNEKEVLEEVTRRLLVAIARLSGAKDYQPELAGRRWRTGAELEASRSR